MTLTLTTGEIAKACGADRWQVLAAIKRGFLAEPRRCGPFRVWTPGDVARVAEALAAGGYRRGERTPTTPRPPGT